MTPDGFEKFDGDYNDYAQFALAQAKEKPKKAEQKVNLYKLRKERESEINRLKGKISRTEAEIERLDGEIAELNGMLSTPEVSADYEKVIALTKELEELTDKQLEIMDEWEQMNSRLAELKEI